MPPRSKPVELMCLFSLKGTNSQEMSHASSSGANVPTSNPTARLDIPELERLVQHYFEQGLATSTRKTYSAGIKKFTDFCSKFGIIQPLPADQSLLCYYVSFLADQGLSPATIKVYLSALRFHHIATGLPIPDRASMPKLKIVDNGIKRTSKSSPSDTPVPSEAIHKKQPIRQNVSIRTSICTYR